VVVKGEVRGFLFDRFWANRQNLSLGRPSAESTGNSQRHSIKAPPGLGTSNFFIEPGELTFTSLVNHLQRGVLIEEVMGVHTVDPVSGDFSLGCSGQWIEKGERAHPVKSIALAGNLYQLFKKVTEVGNDLRFFGRSGLQAF
jgi:PmbA protein